MTGGRSAAFAACLLAAVAGALLMAAPADAGLRQARIGVVGGVGENIERMGDTGVAVVRASVKWSEIERQRPQGAKCATGSYDWSEYDALISDASDAGMRVLPTIVGAPGYAGRKESEVPRVNRRDDMQSYRCFVSELVARYGREGSYFEASGDPSARPVHEWQVWNEPNVEFYAVRVDPRNYGRLVKITHNAIAREDSRAKVILAGGPEFPAKGQNLRPFHNRMLNVKNVDKKFDAFALHPYARNFRGVEGALVRTDRFKKRNGERRTPVWLTEIGWASDGPKRQFPVKSPKGQATQLRKSFELIEDRGKRFKVGTIFWFSWQNRLPPGSNGGWHDYAGLYTFDGEVKPACREYVKFTDGDCIPFDQESSDSEAAGPVRVQSKAASASDDLLGTGPVPEPSRAR